MGTQIHIDLCEECEKTIEIVVVGKVKGTDGMKGGSPRFKKGDYIAYQTKDSAGIETITGEVGGYLDNGEVALKTLDSNEIVCIPTHIPVLIPMVWADTLQPVIREGGEK